MGTVFTIIGRINRRDGYSSAYREAVLNGYGGSQEEWLADIQARLDAGEDLNSGEFNALFSYYRSKRFMCGE